MADVYLTLVHYPILNKSGDIVTTSVTNFDLHYLSRTAKTYGIKKVYILTPSEPQRKMVNFIWDYWHDGYGAKYNPDRKEAFEVLEAVESLDQACLTIENESGIRPYLIATTAKMTPGAETFEGLQRKIGDEEKPILIAFGTGHGLAQEFLQQCDGILEPIQGRGDYNHLPVRSAVAIILDRLVGR